MSIYVHLWLQGESWLPRTVPSHTPIGGKNRQGNRCDAAQNSLSFIWSRISSDAPRLSRGLAAASPGKTTCQQARKGPQSCWSTGRDWKRVVTEGLPCPCVVNFVLVGTPSHGKLSGEDMIVVICTVYMNIYINHICIYSYIYIYIYVYIIIIIYINVFFFWGMRHFDTNRIYCYNRFRLQLAVNTAITAGPVTRSSHAGWATGGGAPHWTETWLGKSPIYCDDFLNL